jgi:hypothetical protein
MRVTTLKNYTRKGRYFFGETFHTETVKVLVKDLIALVKIKGGYRLFYWLSVTHDLGIITDEKGIKLFDVECLKGTLDGKNKIILFNL